MVHPSDHVPIKAQDPRGEETTTYRFNKSLLDKIQRYGHDRLYYNMTMIQKVLLNPFAIFEGLKRENLEGGLCYSGVPSEMQWDEKVRVPFEKRKVFLVFINDKSEIFNWRIEIEHKKDKGFPENHKTRFDKVLWKKSI